MMIGRTGLLTASLFGLSTAVAGCPANTQPQAADADVIEEVADVPPVDVYGLPPDTTDVDETEGPTDIEEVEDTPPVDVYGIPPVDAEDATNAETAEDIPALPPYGIPPEDVRTPDAEPADSTPGDTVEGDAGADEDANEDANESDAETPDDVPALPPYGIPPEDAG